MGRVVAVQLGYDFLPGTTITRYCSSSLQTTRMAAHAIRAGEGDAFISAGVETVSRFVKGNSDSLPDTKNPLFADAQARTARSATERRRRPGTTRARTASSPTSTSHGPDRREPRPAQGRHPRRRWTSSRPARRTTPRRPSPTASSSARSRRCSCPTARSMTKDDGPRAGVTVEGMAGLKPVFRPDGLVTAGNACPLNDGASAVDRHERHQGRRARASPRSPASSPPRSPACRPRSWATARSRPPASRSSAPARPWTTSTCSRSTRPSPRRSSRPTSDLGIPLDKLNPFGGAIAVGPPVRLHRRPHHRHAHQRPADPGQAVGRRDHVRRRRHGHGDGARAPQLDLPPARAHGVAAHAGSRGSHRPVSRRPAGAAERCGRRASSAASSGVAQCGDSPRARARRAARTGAAAGARRRRRLAARCARGRRRSRRAGRAARGRCRAAAGARAPPRRRRRATCARWWTASARVPCGGDAADQRAGVNSRSRATSDAASRPAALAGRGVRSAPSSGPVTGRPPPAPLTGRPARPARAAGCPRPPGAAASSRAARAARGQPGAQGLAVAGGQRPCGPQRAGPTPARSRRSRRRGSRAPAPRRSTARSARATPAPAATAGRRRPRGAARRGPCPGPPHDDLHVGAPGAPGDHLVGPRAPAEHPQPPARHGRRVPGGHQQVDGLALAELGGEHQLAGRRDLVVLLPPAGKQSAHRSRRSSTTVLSQAAPG